MFDKKAYMKEYCRAYYLKHRVLKGRKNIVYSPISCLLCGLITKRSNTRQKVCISCKPILDKKNRDIWFKKNYSISEEFREKRRILVRRNVNKHYLRHLEKNRIRKRAYSNSRRAIGKIDLSIIQKLYEENIKKYGTLTCYLCLSPICFRDDSIEHKKPIFLGGDNSFENLEIAHLKCNIRKGKKLLEGGCFK